jgi:hypothetical protein
MNRLGLLKGHISNVGSDYIYSVPIGIAKKGETRIHRHPDSVDGLLDVPSHIECLADFWD